MGPKNDRAVTNLLLLLLTDEGAWQGVALLCSLQPPTWRRAGELLLLGLPDPPYPKQTKGKLELSSFTGRHTSVFVTGREYILKLTFLVITGIQSYQRKLKYE